MSTNKSKAQLLAELQDEQTAWEALLSAIGEALMTEPGVAGEWSMKDIVAHLTGWRQRSVSRFQAALHHQPVSIPSWPPELQSSADYESDEWVEAVNAWIYTSNRDLPLSAVLQDSRNVFQELVDTLSAFPEEDLMAPDHFAWLEGEPLSGAVFFAHFHEEHEPDIRAWLTRQA